VDREETARTVRRRQAQEILDFEREREKTIHEQIELVVAESEGPRIDAAAFARMSPEDAEIVKEELTPVPLDEGGGFFERDDVIMLEDEADEHAAELARLNGELDDCRRRQRAFEAYVEALGG
jgi:hypothetical protein